MSDIGSVWHVRIERHEEGTGSSMDQKWTQAFYLHDDEGELQRNALIVQSVQNLLGDIARDVQ